MKLKASDNLYYIGGVVRDEFLGAKSFDVDLTYEGNAIEFAKKLDDVEIIKINEPFGTVRVKFNGEEVDIASTRLEIYEKAGHLPTVTKIGCSLKEDVLRRDFTINAMAKNIKTGEIIDYTGGLADLKNKILRVLHDKSFIEDPTRILRALKFAVRFGFALDLHTKKLRDEYLRNINYDMSYKRIKKELIETFNLNSQMAFDEFMEANIYKLVTKNSFVIPKINIENLVNEYSHLIDKSNIWLIYVGCISDLCLIEPTMTKDELKIINDYKNIAQKKLKTDFEIYRAFENLKVESLILYAILKDEYVIKHYLDVLRDVKIELTGKDLMLMNISPSAKYQECFDYILQKKIENISINKDKEIELAKEFFGIK